MDSVKGIGALRLRWRKRNLKPITTNSTTETAQDQPLSPAARLFHEPNFNVYVIAVMGCKTKVNANLVKDKLVHTLLKHPRFSSLQVVDEEDGGRMKWVETKVNLENHVIIPNIDLINIQSPDKFVEDYIFNLTKSTIEKSKPLWDLHILNLKTSDAEAVGVFRIHHSLGDGTSLMSLLLACTRQINDPESLPTIPARKISGGWRRRSAAVPRQWLKAIWFVVVLAWNSLVDVLMFIATAVYLKDTVTPIKAPAGSELTPRRIVYRTLSLDDFKLVKNALNLTINDVALGVTQAALSRYLNRRYGELKGDGGNSESSTEKMNNIPKKIRLRATLLINIRPSSGIQALADMMEKNTEAKWGNWIGYVLLPFSIGLRDDPLDYVREAKSTIDRKKHSLEAIYTFSIAEIVLKLFGIKKASSMSHRIIEHTTMCFSNLVGPIEEIGFYGHPMAFIAPSSYGQPHGLVFNFQSYMNKMTVVVSVDETTIPDPHHLCDDIEDSLKLITDTVVARRTIANAYLQPNP